MGSQKEGPWDPMGGTHMGSHGGDSWDPRVGPWGPIGPWEPLPLGTQALGDPLALGDPGPRGPGPWARIFDLYPNL